MKVDFLSKSNKVITAILSFFVLISLLNLAWDFPLVVFSNLRAAFDFADLYSTLSTIDCYSRIGLSVYSSDNPGYCGNYIYGSDLLWISSIMKLTPSLTSVGGITFIVSVSITFAAFLISTSRTNRIFMFGVLLFLSPGISLLFERGNIDALVFVGLVASGFLASKDRFFSSFAILAILSILKFYTFPCMLIYLILQKNLGRVFFGCSLSIIVFSRIVLSLSRIESEIPEGGYAQFGAKIIGNYLRGLGLQIGYLEGRLIGYLSLTLIVTLLISSKNFKDKTKGRLLIKEDLLTPGFFCAVVFIACYILGLNYDYRLVFFAPFAIWLHDKLNPTRANSRIIIFASLAGAWFSTSIGGFFFADNVFWQRYVVNFFQALGDFSIWFLVAISIAFIVLSINQSVLLYKQRDSVKN